MNGWMKKAGMGIALAATALAAAAPADAQRWRGGYGRHYDRGGDAVAAGLLGGIVGLGVGAAIANSDRGRYYDRGYYNDGYYRAPPRVIYRERYYAPPPPPVVYRERVYDRGYYGGGYYGYGY